jgi:peptidyl-prolyl cis-trans isomerase A (cyclophilin A)
MGCAVLVGLGALAMVDAAAADDDHPVVVLDTSAGPITLELDRTKAPVSVDNFLKYVDSGYYKNLIFHRVIQGFMIQGGGFEDRGTELREKTDGQLDPIKNEAGNGLSNTRGTIAMARTPDPNSATSQFFINLVDNDRLDRSPESAGYAVFGKVIDGMETVDKIAKVATVDKRTNRGMILNDVPSKPITIRSAKRKSKA